MFLNASFEIFLSPERFENFVDEHKAPEGYRWESWDESSLDISSAVNCVINEADIWRRIYLLPNPVQA